MSFDSRPAFNHRRSLSRQQAVSRHSKVTPLSHSSRKHPAREQLRERHVSRAQLIPLFPNSNSVSAAMQKKSKHQTQKRQPGVPVLPSQPPIPIWLRSLKRLERVSTLITLLLGIGVLGVYACTVYLQQRWSDRYQDLQTLQRKERGLTAAIASLKEQAARDAARPGAGLVPQKPNNTIFLSAPPSPGAQVSPSPDPMEKLPLEKSFPQGY